MKKMALNRKFQQKSNKISRKKWKFVGKIQKWANCVPYFLKDQLVAFLRFNKKNRLILITVILIKPT